MNGDVVQLKILALDIGGTEVKSVMFDENGPIGEVMRAPSRTEKDTQPFVTGASVAKLYSGYDYVAVSATGQIDMAKNTLMFSYSLPSDAEGLNYPIGAIVEEMAGKPAFVINDSNAATLAESRFGAGRDYDSMLCLTYGTGVGGGIILNRELFLGTRGIAGEVGHLPIHAGSDLRCGCGHYGCYESYASTTALLRMAREFIPELKNGRELFVQADEDERLQQVISRWVDEIVEGLCALCYMFNPPCIVLGGGVMEQPRLIPMIRERFKERIIPTFSKVDIVPAKLGNKAGLYGAYAYAMSRLGM